MMRYIIFYKHRIKIFLDISHASIYFRIPVSLNELTKDMPSVNFKTGWFHFISNFCPLLNDGYAMNVYHNRHCGSFSAQLGHLQLYCNTKMKCMVCLKKT